MAISKYSTSKGMTKYKATLWFENRAIKSRSFNRKIDASQWLSREETKIQDRRVGRLRGGSVTLHEFFHETYVMNSNVRPATMTDYCRIFRTHIDPILGQKTLLEVSADDWSLHFKSLKVDGMSGARVNRVRAVVSAMYRLAVRWQFLNFNPIQFVAWEQESISEIAFWSREELERFLHWANVHAPARFDIYHFLYETGIRISEALALKWDCIDFDHDTVEVRRAYSRIMNQVEQTTKSGRRRILGMNESLRETLLRCFNSRTSDFVFKDETGKPVNYSVVRRSFRRDQKAAGVSELGIHGLRHTYASHFVMNGGSIYDLKELLGHSQIETTMRYAHLSPKHLQRKSGVVRFELPQSTNVLTFGGANHVPTIEKIKSPDETIELRKGGS